MDPLAIMPRRPWYRYASLWVGVVAVIAIAVAAVLILR